jgi:hypothetical protein
VTILNRKWAVAGASTGIVIPIAIRAYEILRLSAVPAAIKYLFWPTIALTNFSYPITSMLFAILGNGLLFAAVAGILRRKFTLVIFALLISAWLLLPPSDAALKRRFERQRTALQKIIEMSKADPAVVRVTFSQVEAVDGNVYSNTDGEKVLSQIRRAEYTRHLGMLDMREARFNRNGTGEVYVGGQTPGTGAIKSYYAYIYCPERRAAYPSYLPCIQGNDSGRWSSVRYARLERNWYIYKASGPYYIE